MPPSDYERERIRIANRVPVTPSYCYQVTYATNNKKRTRARRTNVKYLSR